MGLAPVGPVLTELLLELDPSAADWNELLATLLAGNAAGRRSACNILGRRPGHESTLLALTHDSEQDVAVRAARGLAQRVATDDDLSTAYLQELLRLAHNSGEAVPLAIVGGVSEAVELNGGSTELLAALLEHASPAVRDEAAELVADRGWLIDRSEATPR
jgi:hypothetical protein